MSEFLVLAILFFKKRDQEENRHGKNSSVGAQRSGRPSLASVRLFLKIGFHF
jgi:hypothetical protein